MSDNALIIGTEGFGETTVSEANTAIAMGSGTLRVFATPAMVALIEKTAWESIASQLGDGCCTVGTAMEVKHTAASPVGMRITCKVVLTEVDGRRIIFHAECFDDKGTIGEATHERFIVYSERFQQKADAKL